MHMKYSILLFCFLVVGCLGYAQDKANVTRYQIDLNKVNDDLPEIYLGVSNAFHVIQSEELDSLQLIADSIFHLSNMQSGNYNIESQRYYNTLPLLPDEIYLVAHFKDGHQKKIKLKTAYIPEVRVEIYLDDRCINDGFRLDSLYSGESIYTHAKLIYPEHVHGYIRLRGVHETEIRSEGNHLGSIVGWYDSGDRSRVYHLPNLSQEFELIVLEDKLKSLAFGSPFGNGVKKLIRLTSDTPRKVRVKGKG